MIKRIIVTLVVVVLLVLIIVVACSSQEAIAPSPPPPVKEFTNTKLSVPAYFRISDLAINPAEVNPGDELFITAMITKIIDTEDSCKVELKINDVTEAVENISIGMGETQPLDFPVSRDVPGNYSFNV